MPNYWLVGAMWDGQVDQYEIFLRRGYWVLGWEDDEQPEQARLRDQIQPNDRIAIKRMLGQGAHNIEIRALGIVKEVDQEDKRVYVDWVVPRVEHRHVHSRGCFSAIHGPYPDNDDWIREIFHI